MNQIDRLAGICQSNKNLELAFLVGSQASGKATTESDWDIALQWKHEMDFMHQLAQTEVLRNQLARSLDIADDNIDLINLPTAGLAMREQVANQGIILKGENTHALSYFLTRTWRELEEFYWDKIYAA
jgi:predicted nucleotidyltransferase